MIDIHCHILPAFDDGSESMAESLAMAKMAVSSGVSGLVTTPHFLGEPASIRRLKPLLERFRMLETALRRERIPLKLYLGAEVLCLPQTPAMAERRALPTIGDTDYILVEFNFDEPGTYMTQMLDILRCNGYKPVVAHPERYDAVQQEPVLCRIWSEEIGCALQLNKGSLLGTFGARVQSSSHFLLEHGLAHLVASDAHNAARRTPHMEPARQWLEQHCGRDCTQVLMERNPSRLLENKTLIPLDFKTNPFL